MSIPSRRTLLILVGVLGILGLGLWLLNRPEPLPPMPDPNGYDRLTSAAGQIAQPRELGDALSGPDYDFETLRNVVMANRDVLHATRDALAMPARVPFSADLQVSMDRLSDLRMLARLLIAEGKVAEDEGRVDEAAASYLLAVQLGHVCTRGAVLVHALVGLAIESIAHDALLQLAPKLDASLARHVLEQLTELEREREPFENVLAAERLWARVTIPWTQAVMTGITDLRQELLQPSIDAGLAARRRVQKLSRLVMLKIALHQLHQQQGGTPESLWEIGVP